MKASILPLLLMMLTVTLAAAPAEASEDDRDDRQRRITQMLATPNPLDPLDSVWLDELTWIEVRDRIRDGYTTAIISTGGIEQNGPYLATGKHNVILESMCPAIAAELGNALCAPIVAFVPEGNIDPPSGHMLFPGTISVRDETFHALLVDIASSLAQHGFRNLVLIGDSGGNQEGMARAAKHLNGLWAESPKRAHFVPEFYTSGWEKTMAYSEQVLGVKESANDGFHDDIWVTAMMMATDPVSVRYEQRVEKGLATINGVDLQPLQRTRDLGEKMVSYRARVTADAIRAAIASE